MEIKFKGHRNVKCLVLEKGMMDFTAFNEQVLAWPDATASMPLGPSTSLPAATPDAPNQFGDLA